MGGKERPPPSLSKQPNEPSHSRPPAEMLHAWKHVKLVPSNDMQRAWVPNASEGQSLEVLQVRVHMRDPLAVTLKQSVPPEQPAATVQDA